MMDNSHSDLLAMVHDHLARHLTEEGDSRNARIERALSRTYPHRNSDAERLLDQLASIRSGAAPNKTEEQWISDISKFSAAIDLAEGAHDRLDDATRAKIRKTISRSRPVKPLPDVRLTTYSLALVSPNVPTLLVANIRPLGDPGLEVVPCGQTPYRTLIASIISKPPEGPFCLIEFDRQTFGPGDLRGSWHEPGSRRTTIGGTLHTYHRHHILALAELLKGGSPDDIVRISYRLKERNTASNRTVIDEAIEKTTGLFPACSDIWDIVEIASECSDTEIDVAAHIARQSATEEEPDHEQRP